LAFASQGDWVRVVPAARQALAADPQNAMAHALLALGLAHLRQPRDAVAAGRQAVALDPEMSFAHYALGWALLEHDDASGAERAAREALRLSPDGDGYALLAQGLTRQRKWREALETASRGLEVDPEHSGLANIRAMALGALGRREEADGAVRDALAAAPDDPAAHANRGWLLLRQSNPDAALESFRAALRLDPSLDWARAGIVEALKARQGLYRVMLRYSLWMGTLSGRARWIIILGLFFGARFARTLMRENPALTPVLGPVLALYVLFVLATWISGPVSNLLLRLNPFGRLVLSADETLASNLIGGCLAIGALAGVLYLVTGGSAWLMVGAASVIMLMPIGGAFSGYGSRAWRPLLAGLVLLSCCAIAAVMLAFVRLDLAVWPFAALLLGSFAFGWVANFLIIKYE
jgi:Tfp pilus assembly protein PilF